MITIPVDVRPEKLCTGETDSSQSFHDFGTKRPSHFRVGSLPDGFPTVCGIVLLPRPDRQHCKDDGPDPLDRADDEIPLVKTIEPMSVENVKSLWVEEFIEP